MSPQKIWKLAKWARKDSDKKYSPPPPDTRLNRRGESNTRSEKFKANVIASDFFPPPRPADVRDVQGLEDGSEIVDIPNIISESVVKEALSNLANGKEPGPDQIPGTLLEYRRSFLKRVLTGIFNVCICYGYYPGKFKKSITAVIKNPLRPSYAAS